MVPEMTIIKNIFETELAVNPQYSAISVLDKFFFLYCQWQKQISSSADLSHMSLNSV